MKKSAVFLTIVVTILTVTIASFYKNVGSIASLYSLDNSSYKRTPGTVGIVFCDSDANRVRRTIECYPTEIYYGDTVYFSEYLTNESDMELSEYTPTDCDSWDWRHIEVSSPEIEGKTYRWRCENPTGMDICRVIRPFFWTPANISVSIGLTRNFVLCRITKILSGKNFVKR